MKHNKGNKGIALLLVISSLAMLSIMMVELTFRGNVNLRITNNFKNSMKARALARSGVYFAMLELKVYKTIREHPLLKKLPNFNTSMLDMIWQFGFLYPPLPSKKASSGVEKDAEELIEESKVDGKIRVEIYDESSKINLNDLADKQLRDGIIQQVETLFEQKKKSDEAFLEKYRDLRVSDLLGNVVDWIDQDNISEGGGDEEGYYGRLRTPYKPKNAPLDTVSELALVEGFDDETLFDLLLQYVTVYPTGGININTATAEMLLSISPELTEEDVKQIIEHREISGGFKSGKDFESFCKDKLLKSTNFNQNPKVPLSTSSKIFSMVSTAEVGGATQTVQVVVDISKLTPQGRPEILYWNFI